MNQAEHDLTVIGGLCSFSDDQGQLDELHSIANLQVHDISGSTHKAVSYVRFVTLKSCTLATNPGIGMDAEAVNWMLEHPGTKTDVELPGVEHASKFVRETGTGVAAEIMIPHIQMPQYERSIPRGMFYPWLPASVILGWAIRELSGYSLRAGYEMGFKTPKWLGTTLKEAEDPFRTEVSSMQRSWEGLYSWLLPGVTANGINRGVDIPEKGTHRNVITHQIARNIKRARPELVLGIDLNHALGDKHRDEIADAVVEALFMTVDGSPINQGGIPLYGLLLAEVGTNSRTDGGQHMTIPEFADALTEVGKHRRLRGPTGSAV